MASQRNSSWKKQEPTKTEKVDFKTAAFMVMSVVVLWVIVSLAGAWAYKTEQCERLLHLESHYPGQLMPSDYSFIRDHCEQKSRVICNATLQKKEEKCREILETEESSSLIFYK